ncbi:hypothetical protein BX285_1377 [Streptomyces sp. 1114.5]|uniref:hypothetical protein n=1 Tax=Streptomyces sp. 1114.5 TaxID=1938830 RepID=UPI000F278C2D|nr:hypothetical protein [Streptomyces sp. 1114.5]RKT17014.1 hypothetical protein BX285_1377 [Streptomyces sp. 1114.5]
MTTVTTVAAMAAVAAAPAAGPVGPGVRAVELAFVLLLCGFATGAVALLGTWRRKGR